MTIHLIPLDHLLRSKRNARKTRTGGVDDLAAWILAHRLLQNLAVLPIDPLPDDGDVTIGRFEVIAARFGVTAAADEAVSPEETAKLGGLKKAELVEAAEALLKHKRWLPAVLRSTRAETDPVF